MLIVARQAVYVTNILKWFIPISMTLPSMFLKFCPTVRRPRIPRLVSGFHRTVDVSRSTVIGRFRKCTGITSRELVLRGQSQNNIRSNHFFLNVWCEIFCDSPYSITSERNCSILSCTYCKNYRFTTLLPYQYHTGTIPMTYGHLTCRENVLNSLILGFLWPYIRYTPTGRAGLTST